MTVKKPEELKQVTDSVLSGLTATNELKAKILYAAAKQKTEPGKESGHSFLRFVPAICCCLALVVCLSVLIPQMRNMTTNQDTLLPAITDMPAGNFSPDSKDTLRTGTQLSSEGRKVTAGTSNPGIFCDNAPGQDANTNKGASEPQIVVLDGCFYRLLNDVFSPEQLKLSSEIGTISVCGSYSVLTEGTKAGSSFLKEGTKVYRLDGMNGAFVAARVEDHLYVFQRVSIDQQGLLSDETLKDILPDVTHIVGIEIEGKGSVTNIDDIKNLMDLLTQNAIAESNGPLNRGEYLILKLDNGLRYQITINQQRLSLCGTWLCPEFIESLENLL